MNREQLVDVVEEANIPILLLVLFQLTGDRAWLAEDCRPTRTPGTSDHNDGGLPPEQQERIRRAAVEAIVANSDGTPAAIAVPDDAQLHAMLRTCTGEEVPWEYVAMARELFVVNAAGHQAPVPAPPNGRPTPSVLVVGAGISGLSVASDLLRRGIDQLQIVDRRAEIGGTWAENNYPGAGVDTPSFLYSFSYFPHIWSQHFGKRAEVRRYLADYADRMMLRDRIRFHTEVVSAVYDEGACHWHVTLMHDGETTQLTVDFVIFAVGQLSVPRVPALPGLEEFAGTACHSAAWPADLNVTGKHVAVVGTGASAMQIVPAIADQVSSLTIFQSEPQWIAPNPKYFTPLEPTLSQALAEIPFYYAWYRFRLAWLFNDRIYPSLQIDPDWKGLPRSINRRNERHRELFAQHIRNQLSDRPDLLEKCMPDYPVFSRRLLLDNGWLEVMKRDHVNLIASRASAIVDGELTATNGESCCPDVIVFATGFQSKRLLAPIDVVGRRGVHIREVWGDDDPRAYIGMTVPLFPNMFVMYGPNTNIGHGGSYMLTAECQASYIAKAISMLHADGVDALECRMSVLEEYNLSVDAKHSRMIWSVPTTPTPYRNRAGRVTNMPWRIVDFWHMTQKPELRNFHLTYRTAEQSAAEPVTANRGESR